MNEYFKSAFTNLSSNWGVNTTESDHPSSPSVNPFVGQTVELDGKRLRVDRVIAEGGFGFVFKVRDVQSHEVYALKRLIAADKEAKKEIENEIDVLMKLQPHPHIMQFISFGLINQNIFLLLSEFCGCGSLLDIPLPITDIGSTIGSCSKLHLPSSKCTSLVTSRGRDVKTHHSNVPAAGNTRHLSPLSNQHCNGHLGVWLFVIYGQVWSPSFRRFGKARIINCNYSIPAGVEENVHTNLIRSCLKVDPSERLTVDGIIAAFESNFVDLRDPCMNPKQPTPTQTYPETFIPPVVPVAQQPLSSIPGSAQPGNFSSKLFGFTSKIKETSSKVMQSVQQTVATRIEKLSPTESESSHETPPSRPTSLPSLPASVPVRPPRPPPPTLSVVLPSRSKSPTNVKPLPPRPEMPNIDPVSQNSVPLHGDPKPADLLSNLVWTQEETQDDVSQGTTSKAATVNLINMSMDDETTNESDLVNLDPLQNLTIGSGHGGSRITADGQPKVPPSSLELLNDVFSNVEVSSSAPTISPSPSTVSSAKSTLIANNSMPRNASSPGRLVDTDPFASLESFKSPITPNLNAMNSVNITPATLLQPSKVTADNSSASNSMPRVSSINNFFQTPLQPNYSRSVFTEANPSSSNPSGLPKKVDDDMFGEFLGGFSSTKREPGNKTLGDLQKVDLLRNGADPLKLKVIEWKKNKTRNIRSLIQSLHTIVWEDCKWQAVGMEQLFEVQDVKKMYRKAVLAIHPDKVTGTENEELAKLIFMELNDAWSEFEKNPV
ncbi:Cyclin-G-associated kinase [Halotydeus destructor]|nr:Cyclin-G-associated kinase [Halotydeus destructor]